MESYSEIRAEVKYRFHSCGIAHTYLRGCDGA